MDTSQSTELETTTSNPASVASTSAPEVSDERKALVKFWNDQIKKARDDSRLKDAFKRMRECQKLAVDGSMDDEWIKSKKYVMPITNRHINMAVASLYARNPTVLAKRREKLLFKIWDGQASTAQGAFQAAQAGDVSQIPLLQDIQQGQQYIQMMDKIGKTLQICAKHYLDQQEYNYKARLKGAVRRGKINGVAYAVLDYQRQIQPRPDQEARIADITSKITNVKYAMQEQSEDGGTADSQDDKINLAQLELNLKDLQNNPDMVMAEGPVLSFPRSTSVLIDPKCTDIKTLVGARWVAVEIPTTAEDIQKTYPNIDLEEEGSGAAEFVDPEKRKEADAPKRYMLIRIWDRENQQVMVLLEGYKDFAEEPATPTTKIYPFFPIYPLVFNEIESEKDLIPPSDVWLVRHPQDELNRSRQGVREHRRANVPFHVVSKGAFEQEDLVKLGTHGAHEVIEMNGLGPNEDIGKKMQRPMLNPMDPAQYDTKGHIEDIMRAVGTQDANMGPTTGATATESSIAENSRQATMADNVDNLDEWLTAIMRGIGQLLLTELSKETAIEIAGQGAVWPDLPETRQQIADDLQLEIEAGSSGRPNQAADLANLERAAGMLVQLPGVNPQPLVKKYLQLLNIDLDESTAEGLPSIQALNAMMSNASRGVPPGGPAPGGPAGAPPPAGPPGAPPGAPPHAGPPPMAPPGGPHAQGPMGVHNQALPPHPTGPMPAHPAPGTGLAPMANHI